MRKALKWVAWLLLGILAICGAVALVIGIAFDGVKDYALGRMDRVACQSYDDIDRIELSLLFPPPGTQPTGTFRVGHEGKEYSVYGTAVISGDEAQHAADLWSYTLKAAKMGAMCHSPPYGVRMYAGKDLRFESTICWECSNFDFQAFPGIATYYGFDAKSQGAKDLLALFDKELPYPKPDRGTQ